MGTKSYMSSHWQPAILPTTRLTSSTSPRSRSRQSLHRSRGTYGSGLHLSILRIDATSQVKPILLQIFPT